MEQAVGLRRVFSDTLWIALLCVALAVCLISLSHAHARYQATQAEHRRIRGELDRLHKEEKTLEDQKDSLENGNPFLYERLGIDLLNLRRPGTIHADEIKSGESRPTETKQMETKQTETRQTETRQSETRPRETKRGGKR